MKKTIRWSLVIPILLVTLISCERINEDVSASPIRNSKKILFRGLEVNHRFATPIEDLLADNKDIEAVKATFNKIRKKKARKNNVLLKVEHAEIPNPKTIIKAIRKVIKDFPYKEHPDFYLNEEKNIHKRKIHKKDIASIIKKDFDNLSESEISDNMEIVEEYYSKNLNYMILLEIAENEVEYNKNTNKNQESKVNSEIVDEGQILACTMGIMTLEGYDPLLITAAFTLAGDRAEESSINHYNDPDIKDQNTREDAYRHMLWSAMLADYYYTISSKNTRINFSKRVTDLREGTCKASGPIDSEAMDLHNNAIGRKIWYDATTYDVLFGANIGLDTPSNATMKSLVFKAVEETSCYIVKDYSDNVHSNNYTEIEVKQLIDSIHLVSPFMPVYFIGTIAPDRFKTTITYDYSNCNDGSPQLKKKGKQNKPAPDDCGERITTVTTIRATFVSKDTSPYYYPGYTVIN